MSPVLPEKTLRPAVFENVIENNLPQLKDLADLTITIPFNMDSSDIGPKEWKILFDIIYLLN